MNIHIPFPSATPAAGGDSPWPQRLWLLTALGGAAGLALHLLTDGAGGQQPLRLALATFLCVGTLAFGFVVERGKLVSSLAFAAAAGLVVALAVYWNKSPGGRADDDLWRLLCAALAVILAAPLFLALRAQGRLARPDYALVHDRAWLHVVLWCAIWVFTGVVWLLAWLLATLLGLIGLDFLDTLLEREWASFLLSGVALGLAVGLLRDRERLLAQVQRVVIAALAALAPVLAAGLALFLLALPFTGLAPLWEATRSTTPILLLCIMGALVLISALTGSSPGDEARAPLLRLCVPVLGLAVLPLGIIASVSLGMRIQQHGLTPDRLWAATFVAIALACGLGCLWAVAGRLRAPAGRLRAAFLKLACGLCLLALLLSTPLLSFGALSARHQLARLESGAVAPDAFDWRALRFDFGPAGVAALKRLAEQGRTPEIRTAAADALRRTSPVEFPDRVPPVRDDQLVVLPEPSAPLPPDLRDALARARVCGDAARCVVVHEAGSAEAIVVTPWDAALWRRMETGWAQDSGMATPDTDARTRLMEGLAAGKVEVRTVTRRQVYVDGQPHGQPFE